MPRIVYFSFSNGEIAGGQKVIFRHVEALRRLGFDAIIWRNPSNPHPTWLDSDAPVEVQTPFAPDDILVLPNDAPNAMAAVAGMAQRSVIFCQNQFSFACFAEQGADAFPADRFPTVITVGATISKTVRRMYPAARIELIPCFADERVFRPGPDRQHAVAASPRKRMMEVKAIEVFLRKFHPRHTALPWRQLINVPEAEVARTFASSTLMLSLSRHESVGMTPLEAMACGCVVAGFTGIGGRDFATAENGFWVPEDDCEAAADALAQAADLVLTGGAHLRRVLEAGRATADAWSYGRFVRDLEEVWMRLAPEARLRTGPLDT